MSPSATGATGSSESFLNFICWTSFRQYWAWCVDRIANAMMEFLASVTSYTKPLAKASSRIFLMNSTDGLVPGWISLRRFLAMRFRRACSDLTISSRITFGAFLGRSSGATRQGIPFETRYLRLRAVFPVNRLISIPGENSFARSSPGSPNM